MSIKSNANSVEERVDSFGSYIPRKDDWYYGNIPEDCTYTKLVKIMANALLKFQEDQKEWIGKCDDLEKVSEILDLWFDETMNCGDMLWMLDNLVPDDDDIGDISAKFRIFKEEVIEKATPPKPEMKCDEHGRGIVFRERCIYCMFDEDEEGTDWDDEYGSLDEVLEDIALGAIELGNKASEKGKELPKLKNTNKDIKLIYKLFQVGYQLGQLGKSKVKHPNKRYTITGNKIEERN
jgi:hypothetical protein